MKSLSRGFTFIEVIVVVAILAILATIITVAYSDVQARGRDVERENDVLTISEALETYYQKNGEYPSILLFANASVEPDMETARATLGNIQSSALISPVLEPGSEHSVTPYIWGFTSSGGTNDQQIAKYGRYRYWVPGETTFPFDSGAVRNTFILSYTKEQDGNDTIISICGRGDNINTSKDVLNNVAIAPPDFSASDCSNF